MALRINNCIVTNVSRKTPGILVLSLSDKNAVEIKGSKEYVDGRQAEIERAVASSSECSDTVMSFNVAKEPVANKSVLVANMPFGMPDMLAPAGEFLSLPQYSFGDCQPAMVANAGDDEGLSLPQYDYAKCR